LKGKEDKALDTVLHSTHGSLPRAHTQPDPPRAHYKSSCFSVPLYVSLIPLLHVHAFIVGGIDHALKALTIVRICVEISGHGPHDKVLMVSSFYSGARLNKYCGLVQIVASYLQARQLCGSHVMEQILREFPQNLFHHMKSTWEKSSHNDMHLTP
jgi:hypothetical protein